ncbi:MAG: bifunctional adenosylcobinamide kinase/adenosylcobinamide-phosphate guanylyltransferase [Candidatus Velthaea sp.]
MLALITGPVRSGKSDYALRVAREFGNPITYVATARLDLGDAEMADRIARHRADRGPEIGVVELWSPGTPDLPALVAAARAGTTLLVDSLGTWIAGHLLDFEELAESDAPAALKKLEARTAALLPRLAGAQADIAIVSEETGWGLVPPTPLGRIFRDHLGRTSARIGRRAGRVHLVVAGYALDLRAAGVPVLPIADSTGA